jgi:hypothetical protein
MSFECEVAYEQAQRLLECICMVSKGILLWIKNSRMSFVICSGISILITKEQVLFITSAAKHDIGDFFKTKAVFSSAEK